MSGAPEKEHVCPKCQKVIMRAGPFKRHTNICGVTHTEKYGRWRHVRSHRWIFEALHGPIPAGLDICHSCDNPGCVNPRHLRADTRSSNIQESFDKGRSSSPMLRPDIVEKMRNSLPDGHGQYIAHVRHHVRKNRTSPTCTLCVECGRIISEPKDGLDSVR